MLDFLSGNSRRPDRARGPAGAPEIANKQSGLQKPESAIMELAVPSASAQLGLIAAGGDQRARAQRFREAALPYLDDVYTLARYLLRNSTDAEDAAQECYLRALKHFDTYRGPAMKPWLFAILRNVCRAENARRSSTPAEMDETEADDDAAPIWQEPPPSPEAAIIRDWDAETIRKLVAQLPRPFREAIVMREINNLSYREIAEVVGVPVGTVMSRLARARCMLRQAWVAEDGPKT
jgi:RNA polymerase sigma-70 factor (ECF subfamily)